MNDAFEGQFAGRGEYGAAQRNWTVLGDFLEGSRAGSPLDGSGNSLRQEQPPGDNIAIPGIDDHLNVLIEEIAFNEFDWRNWENRLPLRDLAGMTMSLSEPVAVKILRAVKWEIDDLGQASPAGDRFKELTVYAMVYNMVRMVMAEAARRQEVAVDRIGFVDALRWRLDSKAGVELVSLKVNPDRSSRVESRVRKRRPKEFPMMKKTRSEWSRQLMGNKVAH